MQPEEMQALLRVWFDRVWSENDVDALDDIITDPYTRHTPAGSETISRDAYKEKLRNTPRLLYRPKTTVDDEVVVGDRIWTRATSRGLNLAMNEVQSLTWMTIHRVENGRLAEAWIAALVEVDWER